MIYKLQLIKELLKEKNNKSVFFKEKLNMSETALKWHKIYLGIAESLAEGSHCVSFKVGAVIVKNRRIISTGINGTPPGSINCDQVFDPKNFDKEKHHTWSLNNELHAEMNAIVTAASEGISIKNSSLYITISPCLHCAKAISMAKIKNIYIRSIYERDVEGLILLLNNNVNIYLLVYI